MVYLFLGYYADTESRCQTFHFCLGQANVGYPFLCGNGTVFNQERLVCDWWFNFDCDTAPSFYNLSQLRVTAAAAAAAQDRWPRPQHAAAGVALSGRGHHPSAVH